MFGKIIKVENEEDLRVELPKEYMHKEIEITADEVDEKSSQDEVNDFSDAKAFFDKFQIDMSQFKFERNEANER